MSFENATTASQAARVLIDHRHWEEAQEILDSALAQFPEDGRLLELYGLYWHAQRRYASACQAFETASSLVPLSLEGQLAMASSYRICGQRDDARTILAYLATRHDLPAELLSRLAANLGQIGEYQLALEVCREATRRTPEQDESLYGMAFYMSQLNYPLECILPLMRHAISLAPTCRVYRLALVSLCSRAELWGEAYETACGLTPGQVTCLNCLQKLLSVFNHVGDRVRRDECLCQILKLEDLRKSGKAPHPAESHLAF